MSSGSRLICIRKVTNITDQAIHALVDAIENDEPTLERVHLSFCDNLTVRAITRLLRYIPGITHLSLTGVNAFRHKQYQAFCREAPSVRWRGVTLPKPMTDLPPGF
jgi:F-box and leucine-rich repeat protein GRR1